MSSAVKDFFIWFDAYGENIPKEPNAAQWKRIKTRAAEVAALLNSGTVAAIVPDGYGAMLADAAVDAPGSKPNKVKVKVKTEKSWRMLVAEQIAKSAGCDPDSAADYARDVPFNIDIDPVDAANTYCAQFPEIRAA